MNFRTLIVDDDQLVIFVCNRMIVKSNFHQNPMSFVNGKQALDHLLENPEPGVKQVIFLDINMPVMNGWEFLDAIQKLPNPENLLVFMVSSSTNETDKQKAALYPNVIDYIEKPVNLQIYEELKRTLPLREFFDL